MRKVTIEVKCTIDTDDSIDVGMTTDGASTMNMIAAKYAINKFFEIQLDDKRRNNKSSNKEEDNKEEQ